MVTAEELKTCQQFTAQNLLNSDHMALLHLPPVSTSDVASLGQPDPDLRGLDTAQLNAVDRFGPYPTEKTCPNTSLCIAQHGLGIPEIPPIDNAFRVPQKRFLIFDQSGSHTRMFFSPSFTPPNHATTSKTIHENVASQLDQQLPAEEVVEENWNGNQISEGEDEMVEDSEEIDALFFSDTDDDEDSESDEVTSDENGYYKEILLEEVASSDGSRKRRKLVDGECKKLSWISGEGPVEWSSSCTYEDDVESRCPGTRISCSDFDCSKREKKVKIRNALKRLEGIFPGLNNNDPIHVIEKAIAFLKSMRMEAAALELESDQKVPKSFIFGIK